MEKYKIALLGGGISSEREVSLNTAKQIEKALAEAGHSIYFYDPKTDLEQLIKDWHDKKFTLVFPALHGQGGEDGQIQGLLDSLDMPYVFSGVEASALAMNKHASLLIAKQLGLNTAKHLLITAISQLDNNLQTITDLGLPLVVKANHGGSSVHMNILEDLNTLNTDVQIILENQDQAILESYISGRELTVTILGNGPTIKALPVIEILPQKNKFYDYESKYANGGSQHICPAQIPETITNLAQDQALLIYQNLGAKDLARVDFIYNELENKIYFLEINTIPGMTATSLAPEAASHIGLSFIQLLEQLIQYNKK